MLLKQGRRTSSLKCEPQLGVRNTDVQKGTGSTVCVPAAFLSLELKRNVTLRVGHSSLFLTISLG